MKKLVMACAFSMAAFAMWAQNSDATVEIEVERVDAGRPIRAHAIYTPADGDTKPASSHTWSITPCTETGEVTEESLFSETYPNAPSDLFTFPGSEDYAYGQFYRIDIYVANDRGDLAATKGTVVQKTTEQPHVVGTTSATLAPGENRAGTLHRLFLGTGSYYYTLTSSGGNFVNGFGLIINNNGIPPSTPFVFSGPDQPLDFSFNVPSNTATCQSQTFRIKFFTITASEVFYFDFTVHCKPHSKQTVVHMGNDLYYKGDDNRIHKMSHTANGWNYQAITPVGGWNNVEVDGWLCGNPASNRIYFKSMDNKIFSLDNNGSTHTLAQVSNVFDVKSNLQLRGNSQLIYIASNNSVKTLTYSSGNWTPFTIITATNYTALNLAYEDLVDGNIYFRDANNAVKGLWLNGSNVWTLVNMPTAIGCGGDMIYDNGMKRVYFRGTDNNIHCTTWDIPSSTWVFDAMVSTNGQISTANSLAHIEGTNTIVFKGTDNRVYATAKQSNGTWHTDWHEGSYTHVAGDLLLDWTHIWFVSKSKELCNYFWNGSSWTVSVLNSSAPTNTLGCSSAYRLAKPQKESNVGQQLSVYPNPSNGTFQVSYVAAVENVQAELFNLVGERLDQFSFSGTSYSYSPSSDLAPGIYLLRITNGGDVTTTQLIVQ